MRTGGVLIHEISRALEWMPNIASVVYSPGPRLVPVERKLMKNILPRGVVHRFSPHVHGESSDSYVDSCQRGIHHLIGAIYASQYSGVREFRVEAAEPLRGTEFTIFVFDFPDPQHLEAGRFFFRKLHKLDMNISLQEPGLPHDRGHVPTHPNARALTQLSNFSNLLSESIDLRELSLHLVHWQSSAQGTYGHAIPPGHPIFPLLGLNTKWPKLRSLSLGGIYAAEEQLIRVLTRHKETLEDLDFKLCSLVSGSWANIVDHVLYNSSILKFCLRKVNETVVGDRDFEDLTSEEMEHWQYEGTLKRDLEGVRYFVSLPEFPCTIAANIDRTSPRVRRYIRDGVKSSKKNDFPTSHPKSQDMTISLIYQRRH